MTNNQREIKGWEKEFDKEFGKAPKGVPIIETIDGRKTCFWCGHPVSPDRELDRLKSFLRTKILKAVKATINRVEKIMADTLSADTLEYHNEVDEMYKKLQELLKEKP